MTGDLLPTLSSDEEDVNPKNHMDDDDDDDEQDVAMNEDFRFGGVLGEDGGSMRMIPRSGWSYQSAMHAIHCHYDGDVLPKMDVSSIIAAKRSLLLKNKHSFKQEDKKQEPKERDGLEVEEESGDDDERQKNSDDESSGADDQDEERGDDEETGDEDNVVEDDDDEDDDQVDDADRQMEEDVLKTRTGEGKQIHNQKLHNLEEEDDDNDDDDDDVMGDTDEDDEKVEQQKAANFFEDSETYFDNHKSISSSDEIQVFAQLTLSRPLLLGVAAMGFVKPTPIQAKVIPIALMGRDVCASAVTGSGKTAAFLLPICERLLQYRSTSLSSGQPTRVKAVILTPTRELAAQCFAMLSSITQHCPNLRSVLIVGGSKNVAAQAAELRTRKPSIVIATPGRLLDHVTNSVGVSLDDVEFLVLDEADRLLDLGFQEEVHELVKTCPKERQTMLFSATMTTKIDELIKLSMKRPVRVHVSDSSSTSRIDSKNGIEVAPRLEQEFVRVRSGNEGINREAMLLSLLTRTFTRHTIAFFDTKVTAHRLMILCGLCGIRCAELHGNLTQAQRLTALEQFRQGEVDILLATDLAARGLDIDRVETVINFEMPSQVETYVHRIGRTARAGRGGKSCTLIGESRRHLMKLVIKDADEKKTRGSIAKHPKNTSGVIRSRTIPPAVIAHFMSKIESLEEHVKEVLQAEEVARMDRIAEMEATRAQNIIAHADEINARPQRGWFATNKEKESTKQAALDKHKQIEENAGSGTHRMTRKKRRAREAREALSANPQDDNEGMSKSNEMTESKIKASARTQKKKKDRRGNEMNELSVHDEDQLLEKQQRQRSKTKRKGAFAADAAGDSTLFDDEKIAFSKKKAKTEEEGPAPSSYNFRGYEPSGKKKTKKSVHGFKSKSKFKRRR